MSKKRYHPLKNYVFFVVLFLMVTGIKQVGKSLLEHVPSRPQEGVGEHGEELMQILRGLEGPHLPGK